MPDSRAHEEVAAALATALAAQEAAARAIAAEPDVEQAFGAATVLGDGLRDLAARAARVRLQQVTRLQAARVAELDHLADEPGADRPAGWTDYLAEVAGVDRSRAGQLSKAARELAARELAQEVRDGVPG
jgi:hypothetical protein